MGDLQDLPIFIIPVSLLIPIIEVEEEKTKYLYGFLMIFGLF